MAPQREKIDLNPNEPATVTLKYGTGKAMPDNGFGPSVMYSTVDNKVLFLDMGTSLRISELGVQPGESIIITRHCKKGQPRYTTVCLSPLTERTRAAKEGVQLQTPLEEQLEGSLANVAEGRPVAAPRPAPIPPAIARKLDTHPEPLGTGTNGPVALPARPPAAHQPVAFLTALIGDANALVDVFAACLEHANQFGNRVKPEDVRALLTTVYINRTSHAA